MDRIIYTYALIKSLYDLEEDYVDCFLPFIIKSFSNKNGLNPTLIQKEVKINYKLHIPIHVLNKILYRAIKRDFLDKDGKLYYITKEGRDYLDNSETENQVNRRIRALIDDMKTFFGEEGYNLSSEDVMDLLCSFINKNIKILVYFVNPSNSKKITYKKLDGNENILVKYIEIAEKNKPDHYITLRDMILGSLISVIVYSKKTAQVSDIKDKWFKCQIFLDTNFIFSLLGLHTDNFNEPAQELFKLLKRYDDFELKVFDFSIDEINNVLRNYSEEYKRYPKNIKINSLYSNLRAKNWAKSDVIRFLTDLENTLIEKGISIEHTGIDIATSDRTSDMINKLEVYKPKSHLNSQIHDLAAIEQIKKFRKKKVRKIEDSNALFLSSDNQLSKFNFIEMGHRDNGTICEVIPDKLLTNLIWLKDPKADISLKAIIESYSRDLFIKKSVWDQFYNVLIELKQDEKIKDENVSMLFYHGHIESILREYDEDDVDTITQDFILREVEKAKLTKDEDIEEIKEKEKEFLEELKKQEQAHTAQIQEMNESLKKAAEKESKRYALISIIIVVICIFSLSIKFLYDSYWALKKSGDTTLLLAILSFTAVFAAILIAITGITKYKGIYDHLKNFLFNRKYKKKLKEAKLEHYSLV